jgi:AraC family transcriptional regulator of adaptative response / DNA-3-methyladenine glycosylase II
VDARRLAFDGPLEWETMLGYFAARAIAGVEHVADGTYHRTIVVDGTPGSIELTRGGPDHLLLRSSVPVTADGRARRIFNLDADLGGAVTHLGADPLIGPLVRARPGLRVPGAWDPFEIGVRAIIGQQVSVAGAGTLTARLVARLGTPIPGSSESVFPAAAALADADLGGIGLTGARISAIRAFAAAVTSGDVKLDRSVSLDGLVASIVAVPGLGPWTAHYLALRIGEPDAFPASDLGIRRNLARLTASEATTAQVTALAERWRPWRALVAAHLWLV